MEPWRPLRQGLGWPFSLTQFAEDTAQPTADRVILLILPQISFPRDFKCIFWGSAVKKSVLCVYFPTVASPLFKERQLLCEWSLTVLSNSISHLGAGSCEHSASIGSKGFSPLQLLLQPVFPRRPHLVSWGLKKWPFVSVWKPWKEWPVLLGALSQLLKCFESNFIHYFTFKKLQCFLLLI